MGRTDSSTNWSLDLSNDKYVRARQRERQKQNAKSGLTAAGFAYGRRNAILDLLHHRHGGPCDTDDAVVWATALVPFIVAVALVHRNRDGSPRCPSDETVACLSHALPAWAGSNLAAITVLVDEAIGKRDAAIEAHDQSGADPVRWLPTMPELVAMLRPTRDEARNLRGWSSIDPPTPDERREADRIRKRAARAAAGATPRSESTSARKPWEAEGISRSTWYARRREADAARTVSSVPYSTPYEADEPVRLAPDNDNLSAERNGCGSGLNRDAA